MLRDEPCYGHLHCTAMQDEISALNVTSELTRHSSQVTMGEAYEPQPAVPGPSAIGGPGAAEGRLETAQPNSVLVGDHAAFEWQARIAVLVTCFLDIGDDWPETLR